MERFANNPVNLLPTLEEWAARLDSILHGVRDEVQRWVPHSACAINGGKATLYDGSEAPCASCRFDDAVIGMRDAIALSKRGRDAWVRSTTHDA